MQTYFVTAVRFIEEDEVKTDVINLHPYKGSSTESRTSCKNHILIDFDAVGNIILKP
jgi:multimeric flavodoxin WrbA